MPPAHRARVSPFKMFSVHEAMDTILGEISKDTVVQYISVKHPSRLVGRILAQDVKAVVPLPPFKASIKDGYAIIAADGAGMRHVSPISSTAGIDPNELGVVSGFCVRINTGAPLPKGADAVVQVEDTELLEFTAVRTNLM